MVVFPRHSPLPRPPPAKGGGVSGRSDLRLRGLVWHRRGLRWAVARPVPRRRRRQHDALRADVRRIRAGPGCRRHGTAACDPAVRVAARQPWRTAALSPWTADNVCGAWRAGSHRDGPAAMVRRRIGWPPAARSRAVPGAGRARSAGTGSRACRLDPRHLSARKAHQRRLPARHRYSASCRAVSSTPRWPPARQAATRRTAP